MVAEKRLAGANIARICFTLLYSNQPSDVPLALDLLNADQRKNLYHLWRELTIEFKPPADAVGEAKAVSLPCEVLPCDVLSYYFDRPNKKFVRESLVSAGMFKQGNKVQLPALVDLSRARKQVVPL